MNRQRLKDMAAVFIIVFLLPYVLTVVLSGAGKSKGAGKTSEYMVTVQKEDREEKVSLNEYLVGVLAAQIPASYEMEALKAQAVLIRTYYFLHEQEGAKQEYLTRGQLESLWGEELEARYKRLEQAVTDTGMEVMQYKQELAEPYFHAVSAGQTRAGGEIFSEKECAYLKQVSCEKDMQAANYVTIRTFTAEQLKEILGTYYEGAGTELLEKPQELFQNIRRDSAGYVLGIEVAGKGISGEVLKEQFGLPSAHVEIEDWEGGVRFVCKGLGHGIGMSLYGANELAKGGKGYKEILQYFFEDVAISAQADEK